MGKVNKETAFRKPHMRGDEPDATGPVSFFVTVNPTCVGMNRISGLHQQNRHSKPHMRGDEPEVSAGGLLCEK